MATLLLSANRVCKTWHEVLNTSPALRQALYFDPEPIRIKSHQECQAVEALNGAVLNPLLAKFFAPCFFDFSHETGHRRRANSFYSMPWVSKPRREHAGVNGIMEALPQYPLLDPELPGDKADRRRFTRKGASWRRMLVSQPPPRHLGYLRMDEDIRGSNVQYFDSFIDAHDIAGLCMGQLYDIVQQSASHHPRLSLWFRVFWGQLRGSFCDDFGKKSMYRLIRQAGVVVELTDSEDRWQGHCQDPLNPGRFDEIFRCDEATPGEVKAPLTAMIEIRVGFRQGLAVNESVY